MMRKTYTSLSKNYRINRNFSAAAEYENFWLPFTNNRAFKKNPVLFHKAKGLFYYTEDGREILDGISGLWCVNAGHSHPTIVKAICDQAATLVFYKQSYILSYFCDYLIMYVLYSRIMHLHSILATNYHFSLLKKF